MNWTAKDARRSRPVTTAMLEAVGEGMFDKDALIGDLLGYLSEAEVADFVRKNEYEEIIGLSVDADAD